MKKRIKASFLARIWRAFSQLLHVWIEWQNAKRWAKENHPGWLAIATNEKASSYTRLVYREKIMNAYRGCEYV